ncbi:hypothetical protein BN177_450039 [Clostridioides difficile E24]|nr:hypothetical protein BN177_450039 [Clostridioides difficile E24]CCL44639.1 hypothetical protein BN178_170032 [Clostridioides difficile T42]CCL49190.1 hypothetical protein BN179_1760016 [Clostridioides difficile T6]CCL53204.1 hypothetical protein BN180_1490006 [Clostridioides difficile E14]CCL57338.1 hypothetical protein BN181_2300017 [Clostridioides difficile T17]
MSVFERVAFNVGTVIAEDTANKPKTTNTLTNPVVNTMANATKALQNIPISISRFSPIFFAKGPVKKPCTTIKIPASTIQITPPCKSNSLFPYSVLLNPKKEFRFINFTSIIIT